MEIANYTFLQELPYRRFSKIVSLDRTFPYLHFRIEEEAAQDISQVCQEVTSNTTILMKDWSKEILRRLKEPLELKVKQVF